MGFYFRAVLIAACIGVAAPAYALRAKNERAERELQAKRDKAARQEESDAEIKRQKALADQPAAARAIGTR